MLRATMRTEMLFAVAACSFATLLSCATDKLATAPVAAVSPPTSPRPSTTSALVAEPSNAVPTPREPVIDTVAGTQIVDPYRWLEDGQSERVRAWGHAQNELTRRLLDAVPGRKELRGDLQELLSLGSIGLPQPRELSKGKWRYFFTRRDGLANQPVLYFRDGLTGADHAVVDVNSMASDGTVSLDWVTPSFDGTSVAYGTSIKGDEDSTLSVRKIDTAGNVTQLTDQILHARHASVAWLPGNKTFFFTRDPMPGEVPAGEEHYHRRVFQHVLGTDPRNDVMVFGKDLPMADMPSVDLSPNGRWLMVHVYRGWSQNSLHLKDLTKKGADFVTVVDGVQARFDAIPLNDQLVIRTNDGAPRGKLMTADPSKPQRANWKELIAQSDDTLDGVHVGAHEIVAGYLHDAAGRVMRFSRKGKLISEVKLPSLGSASIAGADGADEVFVGFTSPVVPWNIYEVALDGHSSGALKTWQALNNPIDPSNVQVAREWAVSKDGTKIPYFVVHSNSVKQDGSAPGVVRGYGGFNQLTEPSFSPTGAEVVRRGGVWVMSVLRGGGEYGEAWHKAGMLGNKQNVFDDQIAIAEDLKAKHIVAPDRLALTGASNGGLLVGAVVTQRPELFRVAVAQVPLMDMVRYQRFAIAKLWIPEYGTSEDPTQFQFLYAYSPYHHVHEGTAYPAIMLTAGESDSRVDPLHARKMTAMLQHASISGEPIVLRTEDKAGHGIGKPTAMRLDEMTDVLSFVFWKLHM
jgi:prolyl oligopeptidase